MAIEHLGEARKSKSYEFYTQYVDIEKEMNAYLDFNPNVFENKTVLLPCDDPEWSNFTKYFAQNFERLKLKKLVSTSYALSTRTQGIINQPTLFETESPKYDPIITVNKGKIFVLRRDKTGDNRINLDDLEWDYLKGDGDFRNGEVKQLRDEADVIITNPPFSLFKEFIDWIFQAEKKFLIIGNVNAITYKKSFSLIKADKMWLGPSITSGDREFRVPSNYPLVAAGCRVDESGQKFIRVKGVRWFTNLDHGKRHQPIPLMTTADNKRYSKHKQVKGAGYEKYDNYDAIEIPFTDSIPSDHKGIMGVPITFLNKYSPDQFEILGMAASAGYNAQVVGIPFLGKRDARPLIKGRNTYARVFIRHKVGNK